MGKLPAAYIWHRVICSHLIYPEISMAKSGLPVSQSDLYLLLPLVWQAYTDHLAAFAAHKNGYTAQLATAQLQALADAHALADAAARAGAAETARQQPEGTASPGTTAQHDANRALYDAYQKLNRDAQRIFRRQPDTARRFQTEYLLGLVRGPGQAGLRGTLTLANGRVAPGVTVAVQGGKAPLETLSDAEGRYALPVPAGDYTVVFSGPGVARQEVPVTVPAGVKKRLDGVVGKEV